MNWSQRTIYAAVAFIVAAIAIGIATYQGGEALYLIVLLAVVGIGAVAVAGGGLRISETSWGAIRHAARRARSGDATEVPLETPPTLLGLYEEIGASAEQIADLHRRNESQDEELRAVRKALGEIQERLKLAKEHETERAVAVDSVASDATISATSLTTGLVTAVENVAEQTSANATAATNIRTVLGSLQEFAQHVEVLAGSAEESSSAILEMTATNEQVAANIGELASSVRETVASIEEMTYSIREVAKNTDALSLTAEETSTSMNQMDVSIDQVQSNANETARLSEEVARDAERGADAILKTIGEIYRIKEGSQEAVSVISNLGSRIEAIGQILSVIDEVAEQTNLLALNAAIIAAQAGEHGKGFAVVADEIKDLAERAGASTREIADLIKTIQSESRNAIHAVEQGAENVDRGVEVSNEAERALKKILESSQKSTHMVRAIARATVEQSKGSKQVTDAIGRIAETTQQIAAATAQQARGSELIMKSGEKMRTISQQVERSSEEQTRGGRQVTQSIENINGLVHQLHAAQRQQIQGSEQALKGAEHGEDTSTRQETALRELLGGGQQLRELLAKLSR